VIPYHPMPLRLMYAKCFWDKALSPSPEQTPTQFSAKSNVEIIPVRR